MFYMLLGTGFEETEAVAPLDLLRRAGIAVSTVGLNGKTVTGSHGIAITADLTAEEWQYEDMEGIILPGGMGGVASIRNCPKAMEAISYAWGHRLLTAAICAGPTILAEMGITDGRNATCFPVCQAQMGDATLQNTAAVIDGNLVTGASAGCAVPFGLALIEAIRDKDSADAIARQIVIR